MPLDLALHLHPLLLPCCVLFRDKVCCLTASGHQESDDRGRDCSSRGRSRRAAGRRTGTHTLSYSRVIHYGAKSPLSSLLPVLMSTYFRVREAEDCQMLFLSFPQHSFFGWEQKMEFIPSPGRWETIRFCCCSSGKCEVNSMSLYACVSSVRTTVAPMISTGKQQDVCMQWLWPALAFDQPLPADRL